MKLNVDEGFIQILPGVSKTTLVTGEIGIGEPPNGTP